MSSHMFSIALVDERFRGDHRFCWLAFGDGSGVCGPDTVKYWANCSGSEAKTILDWFVNEGHAYLKDGLYYAPYFFETDWVARGTKGRSPISSTKRKAVYQSCGFKCHYCGSSEDLTVDHIIPVSSGGGDNMENLTCACKSCNSSKGSKSYDEFLEWRVRNELA